MDLELLTDEDIKFMIMEGIVKGMRTNDGNPPQSEQERIVKASRIAQYIYDNRAVYIKERSILNKFSLN